MPSGGIMKNYCDLIINEQGRECSRCFTFKPWSAFHKCKNGVKGHFSFCKECRKNNVPAQHYKNRIDDFGRECAKCHRYLPWKLFYSHKGCPRDKHTRCIECSIVDVKLRTFNITEQEYKDLLEAHNGICAICGQQETFINQQTGLLQQLSIDHCHTTGKVRGLLCQSCNFAIGCAQDSVGIIESMIHYIESYIPYIYNGKNKPKTKREYELYRAYGITDTEYKQILDNQENVCAICGIEKNGDKHFAVDHCHDSKVIRGLLCINCNTSLGYFRDSTQIMKRAIQYLSNALPRI